MFSLLLTAFASVILWEFSLLSPLVICECLGGWDIGMVSPIHTSVLMFFFIPTNSIHRDTKGARSMASLQTLPDIELLYTFIVWIYLAAHCDSQSTDRPHQHRVGSQAQWRWQPQYHGHGQSGARQMPSPAQITRVGSHFLLVFS